MKKAANRGDLQIRMYSSTRIIAAKPMLSNIVRETDPCIPKILTQNTPISNNGQSMTLLALVAKRVWTAVRTGLQCTSATAIS